MNKSLHLKQYKYKNVVHQNIGSAHSLSTPKGIKGTDWLTNNTLPRRQSIGTGRQFQPLYTDHSLELYSLRCMRQCADTGRHYKPLFTDQTPELITTYPYRINNQISDGLIKPLYTDLLLYMIIDSERRRQIEV